MPTLMGILNLTGDSFSDGSLYLETDKAILHAERMINEGARIIDLGAESTRQGSLPVSAETELSRILPVLQALRDKHPDILFSIDTQKAEVAKRCIELGADIINDISAGRSDPEMLKVIAQNLQVKVILMHMQGTPQNMQDNPSYTDVVKEVMDFLKQRIELCISSGISQNRILIDPGIGFGKTLKHNLELLANLDRFCSLGVPVILGASRKSFINQISPTPVNERQEGSLATACVGLLKGASIFRVHDVLAHKRFFEVFMAIQQTDHKIDNLF